MNRQATPTQATKLDDYRTLGRSGLRVSPLCLGTMTFGTDWGWGAEEGVCREQLDRYAQRGGNFIDTADFYTNGTSERMLGKFLEGRRDSFVLATKYTLSTRPGDPNGGGNSRKTMMRAIEASLRRLKTDYVDLYWVHAWDQRTPIEEVMRGLDDLVRAGKVLYVGFSDYPAWKAAEANTLAKLRGWSPLVALQVKYNLAMRDAERDLIPMAIDQGMGVTPWGPLGAGKLTGKYTRADIDKSGSDADEGSRHSKATITEGELEIADAVKAVADEVGRSPSQVALHWLLRQPGVTSPIVGARKVEHLEDNLGCLDVELSEPQIRRLDEAGAVEPGFPHDFLNSDTVRGYIEGTHTPSAR